MTFRHKYQGVHTGFGILVIHVASTGQVPVCMRNLWSHQKESSNSVSFLVSSDEFKLFIFQKRGRGGDWRGAIIRRNMASFFKNSMCHLVRQDTRLLYVLFSITILGIKHRYTWIIIVMNCFAIYHWCKNKMCDIVLTVTPLAA